MEFMYFELESNVLSCIRQRYLEPSFCKMGAPCGKIPSPRNCVCLNLPKTKLKAIGKAEKRATTDLTNRGFKFENCIISFC